MSDNNFKDLDALVPDELRVRLGGIDYILPGDLPLEVYLRVNKAGELEDQDEEAAIRGVLNAMVDLFSWNYQGKEEYDRIRSEVSGILGQRGVRFNTTLLNNLYSEEAKDEAVAEEAGETNPQ